MQFFNTFVQLVITHSSRFIGKDYKELSLVSLCERKWSFGIALVFGTKNTADICCRFIFVVPYEKKGGCVQIAKDPNLQKCQFVHLWLYINDKLFFSTSSFFPILNKNAPSPYIYKVLNTTASALSRYKNDELCSEKTISGDVLIEVFHSQ